MSPIPLEPEEGRRREIALQDGADLFQCMLTLFSSVRDDTAGRREDPEIAHVRVVGREQDADVAGDPGQDDATDAKRLEQRVERCVEEP
jgi:hypothetical protein